VVGEPGEELVRGGVIAAGGGAEGEQGGLRCPRHAVRPPVLAGRHTAVGLCQYGVRAVDRRTDHRAGGCERRAEDGHDRVPAVPDGDRFDALLDETGGLRRVRA
jgi:hypothetical protein